MLACAVATFGLLALFVLLVSEVVFQHFEFPLAAFVAANPAFAPTGLAQVRFVFDRTQMGGVALDDVGFRD